MITANSVLPYAIDSYAENLEDFVKFYQEQRSEISQLLKIHGAVKICNVPIYDDESFQQIMDSISEEFLSYIDGNSPRTKLSGNMYTSTEYDKSQRITMHNELSYSNVWPAKIFFSCIKAADSQGETLLADSRVIYQKMNLEICKEIESKGVNYIRNLHGGMGMGPSWQHTFETEDQKEVEAHCLRLNIHFKWKEDGGLFLKHKRDGIISHRETGEKIWFNQIDQFHPYHLGGEYYEMIKMLFENPQDYPMYVTYGDGSPISEETVKEIIKTIDETIVEPEWGYKELLIVDNELVAHGRNPYTGERRVLVSMSS